MASGQGTLMVKFDVKSAYLNVAIHPRDRHSWECDVTNIMWAWLSLYISSQLMQTQLMLMLHSKCRHWPVDGNSQPWDWFPAVLVRWFFFTLGPPASPVCYNNPQVCIQLCSKLGLSLHPDKQEGPSTCLSILGIGAWSALQKPLSTAYKELFHIFVAAHLWGPQWTSQQVEFLCDKMSLLALLSSGTSRQGDLKCIWHNFLFRFLVLW